MPLGQRKGQSDVIMNRTSPRSILQTTRKRIDCRTAFLWQMGRLSNLYIRLIKRGFRHRSVLARLTRLPVIGGMMHRALFDGDDILILPRDGSVDITRRIKMDIEFLPENVVLPSQILDRLIRDSSHHLIMNFCICRTSNKCEDYPRNLGCLFMGKAVTKIDDKLGRLVTMDEALEHVRRCREAGLVHLVGRNKLDTIWLGAGPKEDLLTVCNCCPCCCLWKMLPALAPEIGKRVSGVPGVAVRVDGNRCIGCGRCVDDGICFVGAISLWDKATIDEGMCRGCGRCVEFCPQSAVIIELPSSDYVDEVVRKVESLVDLR